MANINEERIKKFKDMGIPVPMAPVDPSMAQGPVRNTEFAKKLAAIKNGAIKETVDVFLEKEKAPAGFVPLELPAKKNQPGKKQEAPLKESIAKPSVSGPSFDAYEKALYGDNTPSSSTYEKASVPGRNYVSDMNEESNGSEFINDIKSRLAEKFSRTTQPAGQVVLNENKSQNNVNTVPAGHILINENQLRETITTISTQLIKKFMSEFLTSEPGLIKESDKIKKAEIIKEDIVKIDGRFFKLTPVTIKKK
jgi:hypothetical protein